MKSISAKKPAAPKVTSTPAMTPLPESLLTLMRNTQISQPAIPFGVPQAQPTSAYSQPGFSSTQPASAYSQPGFPQAQPTSAYSQPGFPSTQPSSAYSQPGFPTTPSASKSQAKKSSEPPSTSAFSQPGFPQAQPASAYSQPGSSSSILAPVLPSPSLFDSLIPDNQFYNLDNDRLREERNNRINNNTTSTSSIYGSGTRYFRF